MEMGQDGGYGPQGLELGAETLATVRKKVQDLTHKNESCFCNDKGIFYYSNEERLKRC